MYPSNVITSAMYAQAPQAECKQQTPTYPDLRIQELHVKTRRVQMQKNSARRSPIAKGPSFRPWQPYD